MTSEKLKNNWKQLGHRGEKLGPDFTQPSIPRKYIPSLLYNL